MGPASSQTHTVRGTARFLQLGTVPAQDLPGAQEPAGSGQGDQRARGSGMRWEENMERHGFMRSHKLGPRIFSRRILNFEQFPNSKLPAVGFKL